jgi:hypothetical protein
MIEKMFIDFRSLLLLAIQCLVQFLLRALFNDKNVSDIRVCKHWTKMKVF